MTESTMTAEPGVPQILGTREFAAPRELVFRAWTEPELMVQWLGPRRLTMKIDEFDLRDGGRWRYIHIEDDGTEYGFHGVFHGTPSVEGIVQTFEFEGAPGHVSMDTATFEDRGASTLMRYNTVFQSVEARDAMLQSGMESGMNEGFERLDELLAKLAANS
jgi:uncharacterized protein YndB with AHSA1/START domain